MKHQAIAVLLVELRNRAGSHSIAQVIRWKLVRCFNSFMMGPLSLGLSQGIKDLLAFVLPPFEVGAINASPVSLL